MVNKNHPYSYCTTNPNYIDLNKDNEERLIAEASKIRDVEKRRKYLQTQGITKEEIELLIDQVHFRTKGRDKFPRAAKMRFTRPTLAMASSKEVAEYRTWKIRQRLGEIKQALDVGAGIGGDTIAMALRWPVVAVENNPETAEMLRHNLNVYEVEQKVTIIQGDITELIHNPEFKESLKNLDVVFFDPSRRSEDKRTVKTEEYIPPLTLVEELVKLCPNLCAKISPGTDLDRIKYDCDIEVISNRGEVKEVDLWFGSLKQSPEKRTIMATKLPEKITLEKQDAKPPEVSGLGQYLYEPDPAYIKAGLINTLAEIHTLSALNPHIAYLTANQLHKTPVMKAFKVVAETSVNPEEINKKLIEWGIGRVDFKARGVDIDLKNIHKQINGTGKGKGVIIFTIIGEEKRAVICQYL